MLTQETIDIIKSTVPALQKHGLDITKVFYKNMFEKNPEVAPMFDMSRQVNDEQPKALAMTVLAAAKNIDSLEKILPAVDKIAIKHCNCGVKPEHYPIVGQHLLNAIQEVLQEGATPAVLKAWQEAYQVIAQVFINKEQEIYMSRQ